MPVLEFEVDKKKYKSMTTDKVVESLKKRGLTIVQKKKKEVVFWWKGKNITINTWTGWFSGKTIESGRGLSNLLKQLDQKDYVR